MCRFLNDSWHHSATPEKELGFRDKKNMCVVPKRQVEQEEDIAIFG
ncbi:hypothetical protein [Microcoleus vaginatus]